ncbi:hypothetical protein F2Q70_00009640 [Brassica cretica]|uniref:NB-ARC domain-containing protein n=1 Tax=Brassica cretica TaxID=69181 RepID=A0A8S9M9J7_BRACR|nr:hypothetical protein F2Q70_00009640 [Brassica cretica]
MTNRPDAFNASSANKSASVFFPRGIHTKQTKSNSAEQAKIFETIPWSSGGPDPELIILISGYEPYLSRTHPPAEPGTRRHQVSVPEQPRLQPNRMMMEKKKIRRKGGNEADLINKVASDVMAVLGFTPSKDFDDFVGIGARITKIKSKFILQSEQVKVLGILGPGGIGIKEIPPWIEKLFRLRKLIMHGCEKLKTISPNISKLENLEFLGLSNYGKCAFGGHNEDNDDDEVYESDDVFEATIEWGPDFKRSWRLRSDFKVHDILQICLPEKAFTSPISLRLRGDGIKTIPDCITRLSGLIKLDVKECRELVALPPLPHSLQSLDA